MFPKAATFSYCCFLFSSFCCSTIQSISYQLQAVYRALCTSAIIANRPHPRTFESVNELGNRIRKYCKNSLEAMDEIACTGHFILGYLESDVYSGTSFIKTFPNKDVGKVYWKPFHSCFLLEYIQCDKHILRALWFHIMSSQYSSWETSDVIASCHHDTRLGKHQMW